MTKKLNNGEWISGIGRRVASAALTLAVALVLGAVSTHSAQAQADQSLAYHEKILYSFTDGNDGGSPEAGLVRDSEGNFYGTASSGGSHGAGVVYKLSSGGESPLYSFTGGSDGSSPWGGLVIGGDGNLYGTASQGGDLSCPLTLYNGCGVVFKVTPSGNETVLYTFKGGADGAIPFSTLVMDAEGNIYGTAFHGGDFKSHGGCVNSAGCGVVFKLGPKGHETILHTFKGGFGGSNPSGGLVMDSKGNLYGNATWGGVISDCPPSCGAVFKIDPKTRIETTVHSFTGCPSHDGCIPTGGVTVDSEGNLFGTTLTGGLGYGIVYKITQGEKNQERILHKFKGTTQDSGGPYAPPVLNAKGILYGCTSGYGASGWGTVYSLTQTGYETVLHDFTGGSDGEYCEAPLLLDMAGNLYGTAVSSDFGSGWGLVFEFTK